MSTFSRLMPLDGDELDGWASRQLGVVVHAEAIRMHPFTGGNGRASRPTTVEASAGRIG